MTNKPFSGRLLDITENGISPHVTANSARPNFEINGPIVPVPLSSSNYQQVKHSEPAFKPASFKRSESVYKSTTINAIIGSHSSFPKENKNTDTLLTDFNSESSDEFEDKSEPITSLNIRVNNQATNNKPNNPRIKLIENNASSGNKLKQNATLSTLGFGEISSARNDLSPKFQIQETWKLSESEQIIHNQPSKSPKSPRYLANFKPILENNAKAPTT